MQNKSKASLSSQPTTPQVTPVECKNLKETRSLGKQVPYVKICTGLDTGRVWSTCPQVEFRDMRFAGLGVCAAKVGFDANLALSHARLRVCCLCLWTPLSGVSVIL